MAKGAKRTGFNSMQLILAAIAIVAIFLVAGNPGITSFFTLSSQSNASNATFQPSIEASAAPSSKPDYPPELYERLKAYQNSADEISKRPAYFGSITDEIFKELPSFPKDFYVIKLLFELGKITDPAKVGSAYWKQPEFYPQFDSQGVPMMINPPQGRWGAFGYGTYPSETVVLSPRSNEFKVAFFIHTSWLVQTYQGLSLIPAFPSSVTLQKSAFPDNSKTVMQDPAAVSKYFDVSISPNVLLLEPAFPVFKQNWAQEVTVLVKVKDAPPGKYAIGINSAGVPPQQANEWLWKYKTNYVGGDSHSLGVPWYTVYIQV